MTHSPEPNEPNKAPAPRRSRWRSRRLWRSLGGGLSLALLAGGGLGAWWAWVFVNQRLASLIAENLGKTLNRPVEVGPLEQISLTGITFGASTLPPTPTDRDRTTVDQVKASYNLWEVLFNRRLGLDITLVRPNAYIDQTDDGKWIVTKLAEAEEESGLKIALDRLQMQDGTVVLDPSAAVMVDAKKPGATLNSDFAVTLRQMSGDVNFEDDYDLTRFDVAGSPSRGGNLRLRGEVNTNPTIKMKVLIQGDGLAVKDVNSLIATPVSTDAGTLFSNLTVQVEDDAITALDGTARLQNVTARVTDVPKLLTQGNAQLRFRNQLITIEQGRTVYGSIPVAFKGTYDLVEGYNLTAQLRGVDLRQVQSTADITLPIPITGAFDADVAITGVPEQPVIRGTVSSRNRVRVDRVDLATVRAQFTLADNVLNLERLSATPSVGGAIAGTGQIVLGERGRITATAQVRNLPGDLIARAYGVNSRDIRVGSLNADVRVAGGFDAVQTAIRWQAPQGTYPARGDIAIAGDRIQFRNTVVQVAGGTLTAQAELANGRWQAAVVGNQIGLRQFSPELRGQFGGDLRLAGSLANLSPSSIRAEGDVRFSQGLSVLNRPLTARIRWLGDRLAIDRATAPGFSANGVVLTQLEGRGAPAISRFDVNLQLQGYDLASLPVTLPAQVQVAGLADFAGRVTGTPAVPRVNGQLQLNNLVVNRLRFEPVLAGVVQVALGEQVELDLRGRQDQIAVQLDGNYRPGSFRVQLDEAIASGTTRGNILYANVDQFPLDLLDLAPAPQAGLGRVAGRATGSAQVNLNTLATTGTVAIANPAIGYIQARQFNGQFRYGNNAFTLLNSELAFANSRYQLDGTATLGSNPQINGQIRTAQGNVQDILTALQWFDLSDIRRGIQSPTYGTAATLQPAAVGQPDDPLIAQLRRFSEILALIDIRQAERAAASPLPSLSQLQGTFAATIDISGSPQAGLGVDFDLQGTNWSWGNDYSVEQVVAQGSFTDGVLDLLPLRLQSGDAFVNFSGTIAQAQTSGQLQAQNIPVEPLRDFAKLPLDITGTLNANALLEGSLGNPSVRGEVILSNATINQTPIEGANTQFSYADARLNLLGQLTANTTEPLNVVGSIPYRFEFMTVSPDSDDISLEINVRDQGLALLNLFNDQVAWQSGQGEVNLRVDGTLMNPTIDGFVALQEATFIAQALPEPLTNVTGRIQFNRSFIDVTSLQGQFRQGQLVAQGVLPIFDRSDLPLSQDGSPTSPLTVALNDLTLNFKGLYSGGVAGQLLVAGTALAPQVGGNIVLSNGQVELPSGTPATATATAQTADPNALTRPPELDNLNIQLDRNLRITLYPILNFLAVGDMTLSGPLAALSPKGTIQLRSGQVNLFTTQFNLVRGYENTAQFVPGRGLDPLLNVQLATSVPEVTRTPTTSNASGGAAEINETIATNLGSLDNVRIQARVNGYASQLFDELELTSSPSRSRNEIIALLGGGFVDTLGRGDSTLAIANLAGSALLTGLQNFISSTIGLSDFRLYPTLLPSATTSDSSLELASELGLDITGNFSASVLAILTADAPTQFNLRYRINDEFLLRGYIDTDSGTGVILEFETRF